MKKNGQDRAAIRRRIEKALRLSKDGRGNKHIAAQARATAVELMVKHGFKESDFDLTEHPEFPGKTVDFYWMKGKKIPFRMRVIAVIVADIYGCEIASACFQSGSIRIAVICQPPKSPKHPLELVASLDREIESAWDNYKKSRSDSKSEAWRTGEKSFLYEIYAALEGLEKKPDERSFFSGLYHALSERLPQERERILRLEQQKAALLADVHYEPAPHNPLALMVIPKPKQEKGNYREFISKAGVDMAVSIIENDREVYPDMENQASEAMGAIEEFSYHAGRAAARSIKLLRTTQ